jgi:hypothetical protein
LDISPGAEAKPQSGFASGVSHTRNSTLEYTKGDVSAPQMRAYRPERSVWSEGSATLLRRLPPSGFSFDGKFFEKCDKNCV